MDKSSATSNAESVTTENKIKYMYLLLNSVKCARNIMGAFKDATLELLSKLIAQLIMIYKTVNSATNMKTLATTNYFDITVVTCWH